MFISGNVQAESMKLTLACEIHFSNFKNIHQAVTTKTVILTALKHQKGGAQRVTQTDDYEFWVMVHGVQSLNKQQRINNFQVAIKNKHSGEFMHAMSDRVYSDQAQPARARISLVEYQAGSLLEKGELFFECQRVK